MLTQAERNDGVYVLVEKSLADGKYQLVSISNTRPAIANARQERVIFSKDLQKFAADFTTYQWEIYADPGNYGQKTEVMRCTPDVSRDKLIAYGPCSSELAETFVPMGVTKEYVAGKITKAAKDSWEDPRRNNRVAPINPWFVLSQSQAIEKLGIKKVEKK